MVREISASAGTSIMRSYIKNRGLEDRTRGRLAVQEVFTAFGNGVYMFAKYGCVLLNAQKTKTQLFTPFVQSLRWPSCVADFAREGRKSIQNET